MHGTGGVHGDTTKPFRVTRSCDETPELQAAACAFGRIRKIYLCLLSKIEI